MHLWVDQASTDLGWAVSCAFDWLSASVILDQQLPDRCSSHDDDKCQTANPAVQAHFKSSLISHSLKFSVYKHDQINIMDDWGTSRYLLLLLSCFSRV